MTAKVNQLLYDLENTPKTTQPALATGGSVATIFGALAVLQFFFPNIPDNVIKILLVVFAIVAPIVTAILTRNKVWSPASVQAVVEESVRRAQEAINKPVLKYNLPVEKTPDPGGGVGDHH